MKKAVLAMVTVAAVMAARAEYLYWMTDGYEGSLSSGDYAELYYMASGDASGTKVAGSREYYWPDETVGYITGVTDLSVLTGAGLDRTAMSYYVEIFSASGESLYNGLEYGSAMAYSELQSHIREADGLAVTPWSAVAAVPEPTGGVLVVLGVALLGLRRKRGEKGGVF